MTAIPERTPERPAERTMAMRAREFFELHQRIHCVDDERAHDALLEELTRPSRPYIVSFVNAHAANLGWNTPSMLESLLRSDLLLRDGIGAKLGLKAFGRPYGLNMNGTDFIPKIARAYKGRHAALFMAGHGPAEAGGRGAGGGGLP
jgi:N-acetylglucosaminyldiphosphoundecaprenol N-acetyl-beta-D-mannosaminyltransferase